MSNSAISGRLGLIGGSGLRDLPGMTNIELVEVVTPFGAASLRTGLLGQVPVAFVQRHGDGHRLSPSHINVRANIAALKRLGCRQILSLSSVGSLRENVPPGSFVLVDQFIDRTVKRENSFFGPGMVVHVPFGEPTCSRMRAVIVQAAGKASIPLHPEGTYVVMEGPQFSTRAESNLHRQWGGTVIGMTAMPEAKLAREAEVCYAMISMATDYDCWSPAQTAVTASMVSEHMHIMRDRVSALVVAAAAELGDVDTADCPAGCQHALDTAIMTAPEQRDPTMSAHLAFLCPRFTAF
jgi:5'-methylthioadenosine phosphorylase